MTGSMHFDPKLFKSGFPGENITDGHVSVVKIQGRFPIFLKNWI